MQPAQEKVNSTSTPKTSASASPLLRIEREFSVPVDRLFEAFTTAEALKSWWWPKGLYADRVEIDFREGGRYFFNMKGHEGSGGGGGMCGEFEEIVRNKRIVMTDYFTDENGHPISPHEAKMPGEWSELMIITYEFEKMENGTSRFTVSQEGVPEVAHPDCIQGWGESLDKLASYLGGREN